MYFFQGGELMKKAMLIINPKAGRMHLKGKVFDIIDALSEEYDVTVYPTKHQGHATELSASAYEQGYDLVVCAGGDGTLNETVEGVMEASQPVPIGYIPTGSTNDFAAGLNLSKNPVQAAADIVKGTLHQQDVGFFNRQRRFTYIASFGAFTEVSYNTDQTLKNQLGHMAYVLEGMKSLSKLKPVSMEIICDGKSMKGDWLFGAVTNASTIGGVLRLRDEYLNFHDGVFEILLIRNPKNIVELNNIIANLARYEYDGEMVQLLHGSRVECLFEGKLSWSLDGEQADSRNHVLIENIHNGIQLKY
jgi:YegS/Rv2252/BmrU family lipid kinase